ncbi:MAG TPA: hypothetical protein ENO03_01000 [Candidatus Aminicenantes bacterium]|nr:hypothetical protein [Candidatus Aminicenantes bacterium]HDT12913.1 hypothetical protein [Candidatus Aminicenantes bacterium]
MRPTIAALSVVALLASVPAAGQTPARFYNVDTEVRIEGTIREIVLEPRYKGTAPFLVLRVEERGGARSFDVEIAPSWFFGQDVHGGERVEIVGSLAEVPGQAPTIIARELRYRGEIFKLRDKRGFPNWQGGSRAKRGIRRFGST